MSISINLDGDVKLSIPFFVSFRDGESFVYSKAEWIKKSKLKIEEKRPARILYTENNIPSTSHHEFLFQQTNKLRYFRKFSAGLCEIFIPDTERLSSEKSQKYISDCIIATLRKEAQIILVNRARELAAQNGFSINDIRVKNMKTRWGSCSSKSNINLNIHLMRLPPHLSDYVILHELVHTIHHNHSLKFWNELDNYVENSKSLAKELRNWSTQSM